MREIGMSTRAIASATGMSKDTAARALSGVANETPAPATGMDGKAYPSSQLRTASTALILGNDKRKSNNGGETPKSRILEYRQRQT